MGNGYGDIYSPVQTGAALLSGVARSYNRHLMMTADLTKFRHQQKRIQAQDAYISTQRANAAADRQYMLTQRPIDEAYRTKQRTQAAADRTRTQTRQDTLWDQSQQDRGFKINQQKNDLRMKIGQASQGYGTEGDIAQYQSQLDALESSYGGNTQQGQPINISQSGTGEYLNEGANEFLTGGPKNRITGFVNQATSEAGPLLSVQTETPISNTTQGIEYFEDPDSGSIRAMRNGKMYETKKLGSGETIDMTRPVKVESAV